MRRQWCQQPARWFRCRCRMCERRQQIAKANGGRGPSNIFDFVVAPDTTRWRSEASLVAKAGGNGGFHARVAASLVRQLMPALGGAGLRRLRERGAMWGAPSPRTSEGLLRIAVQGDAALP